MQISVSGTAERLLRLFSAGVSGRGSGSVFLRHMSHYCTYDSDDVAPPPHLLLTSFSFPLVNCVCCLRAHRRPTHSPLHVLCLAGEARGRLALPLEGRGTPRGTAIPTAGPPMTITRGTRGWSGVRTTTPSTLRSPPFLPRPPLMRLGGHPSVRPPCPGVLS